MHNYHTPHERISFTYSHLSTDTFAHLKTGFLDLALTGQESHRDMQTETARTLMLITIKTYPTLFEAEAAKIALDVADIPCVVVGVGVAMQGGMAGVQLQVPQNYVDEALEVLKED